MGEIALRRSMRSVRVLPSTASHAKAPHAGGATVYIDAEADGELFPAYIVFSDAVLRAMAASPSTERELLAISGVGPVKLERYGDRFLELRRASG